MSLSNVIDRILGKQQSRQAARAAENELWQSCDDPGLKAQMAEVQANLNTARQEAANLRSQNDNLSKPRS
jgi:hypothetical protein